MVTGSRGYHISQSASWPFSESKGCSGQSFRLDFWRIAKKFPDIIAWPSTFATPLFGLSTGCSGMMEDVPRNGSPPNHNKSRLPSIIGYRLELLLSKKICLNYYRLELLWSYCPKNLVVPGPWSLLWRWGPMVWLLSSENDETNAGVDFRVAQHRKHPYWCFFFVG